MVLKQHLNILKKKDSMLNRIEQDKVNSEVWAVSRILGAYRSKNILKKRLKVFERQIHSIPNKKLIRAIKMSTKLENSILQHLSKKKELTPAELMDAIRKSRVNFTEQCFSNAFWSLIDSQQIKLTDDRKLQIMTNTKKHVAKKPLKKSSKKPRKAKIIQRSIDIADQLDGKTLYEAAEYLVSQIKIYGNAKLRLDTIGIYDEHYNRVSIVYESEQTLEERQAENRRKKEMLEREEMQYNILKKKFEKKK